MYLCMSLQSQSVNGGLELVEKFLDGSPVA